MIIDKSNEIEKHVGWWLESIIVEKKGYFITLILTHYHFFPSNSTVVIQIIYSIN